ncbi:MAG: universal stress protein [Dehalococcoidia bacterium]
MRRRPRSVNLRHGQSGASAIRHVTIGSVAMGLIAHSSLPVLCAGSRVRPRPRPDGYRVAITTDGPPASEEAFSAVTTLLRSGRVPVNIIRIYVPTLGDRGDLLEMADCELSLARLKTNYCTGLDIETHVSKKRNTQSAAAAIIEAVETVGASVIAMSTRGHSAQRHVLLGSTALDVLGRSPLPIILVPAGQHAEGN